MNAASLNAFTFGEGSGCVVTTGTNMPATSYNAANLAASSN
jgi:hypothetical protein